MLASKYIAFSALLLGALVLHVEATPRANTPPSKRDFNLQRRLMHEDPLHHGKGDGTEYGQPNSGVCEFPDCIKGSSCYQEVWCSQKHHGGH